MPAALLSLDTLRLSRRTSQALLKEAGLWPELKRRKRLHAERSNAFELWDFRGERVTPMTGANIRARVSSELAAWKNSHPQDVAELRNVLGSARAEPPCEVAP